MTDYVEVFSREDRDGVEYILADSSTRLEDIPLDNHIRDYCNQLPRTAESYADHLSGDFEYLEEDSGDIIITELQDLKNALEQMEISEEEVEGLECMILPKGSLVG